MPAQNPLTKLEQVAKELGELANELDDYLGPSAELALRKWQTEIRTAIDEIQLQATRDAEAR